MNFLKLVLIPHNLKLVSRLRVVRSRPGLFAVRNVTGHLDAQ
jgi:hypothetical protein